MGCLKNIITIVILIFAIIGFNSIGGVDFVKQKIAEYQATTSGKVVEDSKNKGIFELKPNNNKKETKKSNGK